MNKKGFTLIELLAVIVILAVIALIATPIILGVIDKAKQGSAEQSVNGYINAIENQVVASQLKNENVIVDGIYDLPMNNIEVKGSKPTSGWVEIEKGIVKNYSMVVNGYVITKGNETKKGDSATDKPTGGNVVKNGPTKEETTETDTHKGIVYLDPTDLSITCNASNSKSEAETKKGCMKWYIYSEDDNNYTMILDHNTTSVIAWNDNNSAVAYNQSNLYSAVEELKTTSGWKVSPRLITAKEVATITGNTSYDEKTTGTGGAWNFDSKYGWLSDCTDFCTNYGCTTVDTSTNGYWTSTDAPTDGIWTVQQGGVSVIAWNGKSFVRNYNVGVRPVITISKALISE